MEAKEANGMRSSSSEDNLHEHLKGRKQQGSETQQTASRVLTRGAAKKTQTSSVNVNHELPDMEH